MFREKSAPKGLASWLLVKSKSWMELELQCVCGPLIWHNNPIRRESSVCVVGILLKLGQYEGAV